MSGVNRGTRIARVAIPVPICCRTMSAVVPTAGKKSDRQTFSGGRADLVCLFLEPFRAVGWVLESTPVVSGRDCKGVTSSSIRKKTGRRNSVVGWMPENPAEKANSSVFKKCGRTRAGFTSRRGDGYGEEKAMRSAKKGLPLGSGSPWGWRVVR